MQDVNFCLMWCLIATDGYACRQSQVKRNNNFMDRRHFARFLLPKKEKSGCRPEQRGEVGSMEEMHKLFVSKMKFSLIHI